MKYKTAFRLAIRAIDVLVIGLNLPSLLHWVAVIAGELVLWMMGSGNSYIGWTYVIGGILGYGFGVLIGLYLFFGGAWIINRSIPSNRPYCAECGYELTHLPADYRCPECGTPYRHDVPKASPLPSEE